MAPMTTDQIIDGILDREGAGTPPYAVAGDAGGRTSWGISERTHPDLWRPGPPTRDQARARYVRDYVTPFDVLLGVDDRIRVAVIDDAVLAGPLTAVKRLQAVLGVQTDGRIGPNTLRAILARNPAGLVQALVVARAVDTARLVQAVPTNLPFLGGWLIRILGFLPEVT